MTNNVYHICARTEEGYMLINTSVNAADKEEALNKFLYIHRLKDDYDKDNNTIDGMKVEIKEYIIEGKLV
jgi:hypothetical protein